MRRRLLSSTLLVALVAIGVLGIPLGFAGTHLIRNEAIRQLERDAATVGVALAHNLETFHPLDPARLRTLGGGDRQIIVRDRAGRRVVSGPTIRGPVLTATVPIANGATVIVRSSAEPNERRQQLVWLIVAALSLAGIGTAVILANVQARRLTAPLDALALTAERLGSGDFSARVGRSRVPEIDAVGQVLDREAARMAELVERERQFSANASHQLRTPLTALRMQLEELAAFADDPEIVRSDAATALAQADLLDATITELLALARHGQMSPPVNIDATALVVDRSLAWTGAFDQAHRQLIIKPSLPLMVSTSPAALGQCLDVLLDNALHHGAGVVTVRTQSVGSGGIIEVTDEGPGISVGMEDVIFTRNVSTAGRSGVGLHLARTLMQAHGARLELTRSRPPTLRVFLPSANGDAQ